MAHTAPASCAVLTSLAVNSARLLCFAMYRAHSAGMGCTPLGCARVRSWGACDTEKEAQRGAAKTMRYRPCATHLSTWPATFGTVTSWSPPPPRCRSRPRPPPRPVARRPAWTGPFRRPQTRSGRGPRPGRRPECPRRPVRRRRPSPPPQAGVSSSPRRGRRPVPRRAAPS
eukprot:5629909-Pleurochrysis_carterae.AAC.1